MTYDLYKEAAAALFGIPISAVTRAQREVGKARVLAAGYGGSWTQGLPGSPVIDLEKSEYETVDSPVLRP